ncbi:hypothetical protein B0H13DRAFT_1937108, partial [Mycena leptocephala]
MYTSFHSFFPTTCLATLRMPPTTRSDLSEPQGFPNIPQARAMPVTRMYGRVWRNWQTDIAEGQDVDWAVQEPAAVQPSATPFDYHAMVSTIESLRATHHLFQVGQLTTREKLTELHQWTLSDDLDNPPILVIESGSMAVPTSALAVGINGYFYCNLSAKAFRSSIYLLDYLRANITLTPNRFGNRKRVFVERPFPADDENRFEFLGEFVVDVPYPYGKQFWQTIPQERKLSILVQYAMANVALDPAAQLHDIGNGYFVGSLVQSYYHNEDFTPLVALMRYPQANCFYIAMGLQDSDSDSDSDDSDLESESEESLDEYADLPSPPPPYSP